VQDPERVKTILKTTAKMTFRLVSADPVPTTGRAPPGTDILPAENEPGPDGKPRAYLIRKRIEVDGGDLTNASAGMNQQTGEWVVNFAFNSQGTRRFAQVSEANVGKPFAIVLDNKVISAPVIREPITGGRGQISGRFTAATATDLATLLRAGALPVPLKFIEERTVGPDLGADSIKAGIYSVIIGMLLVMGFMMLAYGLFGVFACLALLVNLALILGGLSLLQATLTLPGLVGILLSIGMSVDANVLINERVREETLRGRSPLGAMQVGFSRAFGTILDANLTTLIKMMLLFIFGSGPIKGFAVTISLGIMTSMFTAIMLVRMLMAEWLRRFRPKVLALWRFRLVRDSTRINFMKGRIAGLVVSAVLSVASVVLYFHPGLNLGIDFRGGVVMEVRTPAVADFAKMRPSLEGLGLGPVVLQTFGSDQDVLIRFDRQPGGDAAQQAAVAKVRGALDKDYAGTQVRRVEAVGATVSDELFRDGMLALGLALVAMLIYIWFRFEWQFGVGAVVTLVLDMTKIVGVYAVTQFQFNLTAIVAILTIMGYSINDKVVVYDRVRENLRLYKNMPLRELIDLSINETLNRTIATSMTIFLATLPLALFAGEALRDFAIVLLIGIVIGTSSSIFIAAPILLFLGQKALRPGSPSRVAAEQAAEKSADKGKSQSGKKAPAE
jgi:SecD/SecF fusion protein